MNSQANTYCILPFMHAQVETDGKLAPCCRYQFDRNDHYTLKDFDHWWATDMQTLRDDLLAGRRHSRCQNCWNDEDRGVQSYRQDSLQMFQHLGQPTEPREYPVFWMMGIGNYCNIRCIMCSPFKSTNWTAEYERNKEKFYSIGIEYDGYPRGAWQQADLAMLEKVAVDAEKIHFSGGEPLMTQDYLRVLASAKNPSATILHINSNLQELSEEWIEQLTKFKTHINVSLEGHGAHNDYIRYGSDWQSITTNIKRLRERGISVGVTHAFGRTSLRTIVPLMIFCLNQQLPITFTPLRWPRYLSIASAPPEEREEFRRLWGVRPVLKSVTGYHRINELVELIKTEPYEPELNDQFWKFIELMDQLHGMEYKKL